MGVIIKSASFAIKLVLLSVTLILVLSACNGDKKESDSNQEKQNGDGQKSISIGLDPYNYATVPAYLSKEILEQEGYEVKIKEAQIGILYEALSGGDIDAFIDIWSPNLHSSYLKKYKNNFEVAGTLYSEMPLGEAVPTYMKDVNSISDLKKYREKLDGKVYAIDPGIQRKIHLCLLPFVISPYLSVIRARAPQSCCAVPHLFHHRLSVRMMTGSGPQSSIDRGIPTVIIFHVPESPDNPPTCQQKSSIE